MKAFRLKPNDDCFLRMLGFGRPSPPKGAYLNLQSPFLEIVEINRIILIKICYNHIIGKPVRLVQENGLVKEIK